MLWNAVNGRLELPGGALDYVRFGRGGQVLVMVPGLGDGLRTVRGMALPMAWTYRKLARRFTVYVFSRGDPLRPGCTTRDMADELVRAQQALGLPPVCLLGVSQGGMVAQHVAIDHPERVEKLILAVTLARQNDTVRRVVGGWIDMARRGDYAGLMLDTAEKTYTPARMKRMRRYSALLGRVGRPKDFGRFITQAQACLGHDAWDGLPRITCPTLVIGGSEDRIVTPEASVEIASRIPGSRLYMCEGYGHGAYEEMPGFMDRVGAFCEEEPEGGA